MDRSFEPDTRFEPANRLTAFDLVRDREPGSALSPEREQEFVAAVRTAIDAAAEGRPSMTEFLQRLERQGVQPVPSVQQSGRLNGMSYEVSGIRIKGSDLGRNYTAHGLIHSKEISFDPDRDLSVCREAAIRAKENPDRLQIFERRPDREHEERAREYDRLTASEVSALRDIGRFRTIRADDFVRIHYNGNDAQWQKDFRNLKRQGFVDRQQVVVRMRSKEKERATERLSVLVLTKEAKQLMRRFDPELKAAHQAVYFGFVKQAEIAHDTSIYRMFTAEAKAIEAGGGQVRRVVLDFELKKTVFSQLVAARKRSDEAYRAEQKRLADESGLFVIDGKIRLPDLRIEYRSADGQELHVDLEMATEHYRADHLGVKSAAGFKIYADAASFPPGGSYGRSGVSDDDHLHIFEL